MAKVTFMNWDENAEEMRLLTLDEGETHEREWGGPTDEGYSYGGETLRHEGDRIVSYRWTRSRDCDGPLDTASESECSVYRLHAYYNAHTGKYLPDWERVNESQRDYFAEAAGY